MTATLSSDLVRQDVSHKLSEVSSVCAQVALDSLLLRPVRLLAATAEGRDRVESLKSLLEAAYGYRRTDTRITRHAPSAGARYPTEIAIVASIDGRWRCAVFDFVEQAFYESVDVRRGAQLAEFLRLEPDAAFLGAISVLWRTVQRYGMRGHRYCIVDAVCVVSNLVELGRDSDCRPVCVGPAHCAAVTKLMELPASSPIVAGAKLTITDVTIPDCARPSAKTATNGLSTIREETPSLSPVLKRVERFHERAAAESLASDCNPPSVSAEIRRPYKWAAERHSMKDGCSGVLPQPLEAELNKYLIGIVKQSRAFGLINLVLVYVRLSPTLQARTAYVCDAGGHRERVPILREAGSDEIASRCFENQNVVKVASSIALIGANRCQLVNHGGYIEACHQVGHSISEFYRVATALGISSTAIGGYSWTAFSQYLDLPGFYPLMAHAFGYGDDSGAKPDAEAWLHVSAPPEQPAHVAPKGQTGRSRRCDA